MALSSVQPVIDKPHKGGGLFGSLLGGLVGLGAAVAAPFTGGASLAAEAAAAPAAAAATAGGIGATLAGAAAATGAGMQLGGMAGEVVDPSKAATQNQSIPTYQAESMPIQAMKMDPHVQMATMQNSKSLLGQSSLPNAEDYISMINQAQEKLKNRIG